MESEEEEEDEPTDEESEPKEIVEQKVKKLKTIIVEKSRDKELKPRKKTTKKILEYLNED